MNEQIGTGNGQQRDAKRKFDAIGKSIILYDFHYHKIKLIFHIKLSVKLAQCVNIPNLEIQNVIN